MSRRDERYSTDQLIKDSRFHRAALEADPKVIGLEPEVRALEDRLRTAQTSTENAEYERMKRLAIFTRTDFDLDWEVRQVEMDALKAVHKKRQAAEYKAVFPKGLDGIIELRGEAESNAVRTMRSALGDNLPDLEQEHGETLEVLCAASAAAEREWKASEQKYAETFAKEVKARVELTRLFHKHEGELLRAYPAQKDRVRTYFRSRPTTQEEPQQGKANPGPKAVVGPAAEGAPKA